MGWTGLDWLGLEVDWIGDRLDWIGSGTGKELIGGELDSIEGGLDWMWIGFNFIEYGLDWRWMDSNIFYRPTSTQQQKQPSSRCPLARSIHFYIRRANDFTRVSSIKSIKTKIESQTENIDGYVLA